MEDQCDLSKLKKKSGKKRKNSRSKGQRFEREVVALFNERFSTTDFMRSPGSGAYATTHRVPEDMRIYGDLITPKWFKFTVECKSGYNHLDISHFLDKNSALWALILQASNDAKAANKEPLLIVKQDRRKPLVFTKEVYWLEALERKKEVISHVTVDGWKMLTLEEFLKFEDSYFQI